MHTEAKILLVQFRDDDMRAHEHACVIEHGKLKAEQITTSDALTDPPEPDSVREYDAILLGGSGGYCVSEGNIKTLPRVYELCRAARLNKTPTLGICFGAHVLTEAFGGRVEYMPAHQETGSFEILVNQHAESDLLFSSVPKRFWAQMGHKDFMTALPPGAVHLGSSERAAYQAWKFPNEPVYAVQFHPELTKEGLTTRIMYYLDQYIGDDQGALKAIIENAKSSDEATRVLTNFIEFAHMHRALRVKAESA